MFVWITAIFMTVVFVSGISGMTSQPPPVAHHAPDYVGEEQPLPMTEAEEWQEFHSLAYSEYFAEFATLFNGYETCWSKNGRLMLRNGDSGPYKFVKRSNV